MKIAVASQNRKTITEHAGRCRKFWVFDIRDGQIVGSILLELPRDESFHDSSPLAPHPLDDVDVLIAGGMGQGLARRLERRGMHPVVTAETDPETAVRQYLAGTLQVLPAHGHHGGHEHGHRHG